MGTKGEFSYLSINNSYVSLIAYLGFRFFSPSNDDVSIKHYPDSNDDETTTKSDDIISWSSTNTKSPTYTSFHVTFINLPSLPNIYAGDEFISLSDLCLYQSSNPSLAIDNDTTNTNGAYLYSFHIIQLLKKDLMGILQENIAI